MMSVWRVDGAVQARGGERHQLAVGVLPSRVRETERKAGQPCSVADTAVCEISSKVVTSA